MTTTITTVTAPELLTDIMMAGHVPMLTSSPGLGKSSIAAQIAKKHNLKLIDIRLAQSDPTDLNGFPSVVDGKATYMPMDIFPLEGDELPIRSDGKKYDGWLMLMDEFPSASMAVQAAAYKIVLDRMIGQHPLHERVLMMCAGNKMSDKAVANRLGTAMQSRLIHLEMVVSVDGWLEWAHNNDIDYRIIGFINWKKELLHNFDPNHNDHTFPCPRTWEFLSDIVKNWVDIPINKRPIASGTIGEGAGTAFVGFCDIFSKLPSIESILMAPGTVTIPDEPSIKYALTSVITKHFNEKTGDSLMLLVNRLDLEFQVITLKQIIKTNPLLLSIPSVNDWTVKNGQRLVG